MLVALPVLLATACEPPQELILPTAEQARAYYQSVGDLQDVEVNGNVVVVVVRQPAEQLRRGGSLWARVGPYIYLFSDETQTLFNDFNGLAGVRVITETGNGTVIANALLARDALTDVLWRRSLNIAGKARRDGTERITLLEDLINWGEDHTEFEYNQRYVPRR